jgi:starch synthase
MAAGRAIVATRVGGVPEIVEDGVNGVLIPNDDFSALSTAIKQLSLDGLLRSRLGLAGHQIARKFSWEAIADQYCELYSKAPAQANRRLLQV